MSISSVAVLTPFHPSMIEQTEDEKATVSDMDQTKDALDQFNHPRQRRALILSELQARSQENSSLDATFEVPTEIMSVKEWMELYSPSHSQGLLTFLASAWSEWDSFQQGRSGSRKTHLFSGGAPLFRDMDNQRPSQSVMGQMGYYCTDSHTAGENTEIHIIIFSTV